MRLVAQTQAWRNKLARRCARYLPFSSRLRRDLPPHLAQIRAATAELDQVMGEIEACFIEVSNTVERTTNTGQELVNHGESLIALALGQGGGEILIEATAEHIWRGIEFVEGNVRATDALVTQLRAITAQIEHALGAEQDLARTLAPLTYVQTLFRIESAALAPEVQTMFQALALEIERVRQQVEAEFRDKFQLLRDIQAILHRAIAQLGQKAAEAKLSVADLRTHLTRSLAQMKAGYEKNRDRDTRLAGVSKAVATETGRVVMSLQFFDIFTQKLQHTRKILTEMETGVTRLSPDRAAAGRTLRFLHQSGQVCVAQIATMNTEFTQAGAALAAGLQGIIQQMAALDGDCIALRDLDSVTTGVDGAIQILLDSLADVQRLVGEAEHFATESHQTIEPVGRMTSNFTRFIRNLAFEIQLIGLNAEVQSAHVGQGTGLDILSAQTSAISRETSRLSTGLGVELDSLTTGLNQIVVAFGDIRERSIDFNRALVTDATGDTSGLHDYRDRALKVLHCIGDLLPQLEAQTRTAAAQADFVKIAHEPLATLQAAVSGLTDAAQAAADGSDLPMETTGLTDHFFTYYTMASEGDVHPQALGLAVHAVAAPSATDDVDLSSSDLAAPGQGDIELFGFDAPAPTPGTAPAPPSPTAEIDLWFDPPSASSAMPTAPTNPDQRLSA
jgi:hypothetical protein